MYNLIPSKISSNLTILNTIKQASESGFIEKVILETDKRSNSLKLKEVYFKEIDEWLKGKHIEVVAFRNEIDLDANNPEKIANAIKPLGSMKLDRHRTWWGVSY